MGIPFLNNIIINSAEHVQFKTTAGADAGKIDQVNNDLVITNAVGDVLLGDGSSDVYIGDGVNNVDILFEQSGSIKADSGTSGVTLTLGSSNTGLVLTSGADIDVTANLDVDGTVDLSNLTIDTAQGADGQVLTSTGSGIAWEDIASETAERIEVTVKNISGGSLSKGTVVHASPSATPPSGNVIEVIAADYDDSTKMPAIGILNETIANEAEGEAVMMGAVSGIDTSSFSVGDELYVGNLGALTNTKPATAGQLIQKIAVVIKSHASNGLIKIFGAGRSNDVPLPLYIDNANQRVGIGTASPAQKLEISGKILLQNNDEIRFKDSGGTERTAIELDPSNNFNIGTSAGGNLRFINGSSYTERTRITSAGNVGIGTDSPARLFHVKQGSSSMVASFESASGTNSFICFSNTASTADQVRLGSTSGNLVLSTNYTERIRIASNGLVGIGTTNPGKTLDVNGDIRLLGTNQFLEGESPTTRLRNMTALPGGYIEPDTFNFRFDESATAYAGESFAIGGTISQTTGTAISDANLKRLFTYTAGYINLNTHKDSNNNVVIELDGISVTNSANNQWKPYVFFHASASNVATMTIEVKNGAGNYETVENAIDCVDFYIRDGFYQTSQGILKGARFTFTNITGNSYLRMIGVIGKTHASYQWNVLKSGSKMFGDLNFGDTKRATFGDGEDLRILHESNNSYIHHTGAGSLYMKADTGNIQIINYTNDSDIVLSSDDGSGGTTPYLTIDGSTTHAYFSNPGNVGIGTTSPGHKLTVLGGNIQTDGIVYANTIRDNTGGNVVIQDNSGGVGIGTASPHTGTKLHIANGSSEGVEFQVAHLTNVNRILSYNRSSSVYNTLKLEGLDHQFYVSGSEKMRINSSGNVGIGTTAPSQKLEVVGNIHATGARHISASYDANHYIRFESLSSGGVMKATDGGVITTLVRSYGDSYFNGGNFGIGTTSPYTNFEVVGKGSFGVAGSSNLGVEISSVSAIPTAQVKGYIASATSSAGGSNGDLLIASRTSASTNIRFFAGSTSEKMRLDSSGFVGIGTTSPDTFLHIDSASTNNIPLKVESGASTSYVQFMDTGTTANFKVRVGSNGDNLLLWAGGSERLRINSSGNVGIGTTSPNTTLEVGDCDSSSNIDDGNLAVKTNTNDTAITIQEASGAEQWGLGVNVDGDLIFTDSGTERIRFDDGGNVGIGTTSPDRLLVLNHASDTRVKLQVNGTDTAQIQTLSNEARYHALGVAGILEFWTNGSEKARITPAGLIGVGVTNPSQKLHIKADDATLLLQDTTTGFSSQASGIILTSSDGSGNPRTDVQYKLKVNSNTFEITYGSSNSQRLKIDSNGRIFVPGLGGSSNSNPDVRYNTTTDELYYNSSSIRYKEDITDLENSLDKINNLRPVKFKDKESGEYATGLIAEEVVDVLPELVFKRQIEGFDQPQIDGVSYGDLHAYYIKAIQQLKSEIETLKSQIN